jgi:hypothetical protein
MNIASKNIWTLNKDPAIKAILLMLQHKTSPDAFVLIDPDSLNEKAVRIASSATQRELSAYIYSYAQRENHYGLDLEFPYLIETRADDQTIRLNELSMEEVLEKVTEHLEIKIHEGCG